MDMGENKTTVFVGDRGQEIVPVPRRLTQGGVETYGLAEVAGRPGGLILGEGDVGKSTYAVMLCNAARRHGPAMLWQLRSGNLDFDIPEPPPGQVTTIVLDGLDECRECGVPLVERFGSLDPEKYHVWVTSRGGGVPKVVRAHRRFSAVYELAPFSSRDVEALADAVGVNGADFVRTVTMCNFDSFLAKPGGVIALLNLYAGGELSELRIEDLMRRLAMRLVTWSRDGADKDEYDLPWSVVRLYDSAEWIAACLACSGRAAVWTGSPNECPEGDLSIDELALDGDDRRLLLGTLDSRMFEPLSPTRLRVANADMAGYLAGRWASRHLPSDELSRLAFHGEDGSVFAVSTLVWACCCRPELGLKYVRDNPILFLRCPGVVSRLGFREYAEAAGNWCRSIPTERLNRVLNAWMFRFGSHHPEFADWLAMHVARYVHDTVAYFAVSALLIASTRDFHNAACVILDGLRSVDLDHSPFARETARGLLVGLCELCRRRSPVFLGRSTVSLSDVLGELGERPEKARLDEPFDPETVTSDAHCQPLAWDGVMRDVPTEAFEEWCLALDDERDPIWSVETLRSSRRTPRADLALAAAADGPSPQPRVGKFGRFDVTRRDKDTVYRDRILGREYVISNGTKTKQTIEFCLIRLSVGDRSWNDDWRKVKGQFQSFGARRFNGDQILHDRETSATTGLQMLRGNGKWRIRTDAEIKKLKRARASRR